MGGLIRDRGEDIRLSDKGHYQILDRHSRFVYTKPFRNLQIEITEVYVLFCPVLVFECKSVEVRGEPANLN